ncbi:TPA: hypothetical protein ACGO85_002141 [Streptococcus suis]
MKQHPTVETLFQHFPNGHINSDFTFCVDPRGQITIPLDEIEHLHEVKPYLLAGASSEIVSGTVSIFPWVNALYRRRLLKAVNRFCDTRLTADDFRDLDSAFGQYSNMKLARDFVRHACHMGLIDRYLEA